MAMAFGITSAEGREGEEKGFLRRDGREDRMEEPVFSLVIREM
jgi:hypothetical protein